MIIAKKNAAYYLSFAAIDSTTPASYKSSVSPVDTAYYKDGAGAWTSLAISDTATEIGSTGIYEIDLSASEMNHDRVVIKFAASGMADDGYQFDLQTKLVDDLNDIAATAIVSAGAINTSSGAVETDAASRTASKADVSGLATSVALATVDGIVDTILLDTDELQTNQGAWATATGFATSGDLAAVDSNVDAILIDTGTTLPAQITGLNDFDPATDTVANVTLVATTTTNTDMRGTDSAATATALATVDAVVDLIKIDTALIDSMGVAKNQAFDNFEFLMVLASDGRTPATGLTVTGQKSINGGAFVSISGVIAEVSNGMYQLDALAADTNGDVITWRFSAATADDTLETFKTIS